MSCYSSCDGPYLEEWVHAHMRKRCLLEFLFCRKKKMVGTKRVTIQEKTDVTESSRHQKTDTEDSSNVNELALEIVKRAIAAAIKFVEESKNPIKNIQWLTHGEFTAEKGRRQIEKFVLTWEYQERWVHHTQFIERKDVVHSYYYLYCVRWSIPTAMRPMLQVSASAYFTVKITKNKPPDMPIEVSYVFEGHSLVHRPGMTRFREKWLRDITEAKSILMESIAF
ncbi:A-kinase anchor protein 14 isoform X1 [Felis catus]|uniref:A-kinase anchor protein 14 isoform X1 n=1 Tax=Felis catus TaxID=9685 RepID=UPI001D1A0EAB|nr:A-kinase anchor protein 14 isoform X1 [Felis catus]